MLSVGKVTAANAGYWQDSVARGREDYYSGAGEAPGVWVGRADLLGRGAGDVVTATESALLLSALSAPDGTQLGRRVTASVTNEGTAMEKRLNPVTAHDLTFSAPKSVSTLWAVGGAGVAGEVEAAHTAAIDAVLGWLDRHAVFTRTGAAGVNVVDADGLIGVRYRHRTSRALDPQLHDHVLVANIVKTSEDGKWRRIDGRALYKAAKPAGMIYQAALRAELGGRLGVEFGAVDVHGQADIVGIDERLIERWSSRGREIDQQLDEWTEQFTERNDRPPTPTERRTAHQTIVLATRPAKPDGSHATDSLHDRWRVEADNAGVDVAAMVNDVCGRRAAKATAASAEQVIASTSAQSAAWSPWELAGNAARTISARATASSVVSAVETITAEALAGSEVVELTATEPAHDKVNRRRDGRRVDEVPSAVRYSSTAHLQLEHIVDVWAKQPQLDYDFEAFTNSDADGLDQSQAVAAAALVRDVRPVHVVIGPAGAGKTTMLARAVQAWERGGIEVIGLAPAATAAAQLGQGAGVQHDTLAKFLEQHRPGPRRAAPRPAGSVVIVDEAAMASTRDLAQLAAVAARDKLRVVLVGDHRQLGAVGPGGMFEELAADNAVSVLDLDHIHRFAERWEADASRLLRAGDATVIDTYNSHGRIEVHPGRSAALDDLADRAVADLIEGVDTLTMAHRNSDVVDLNDRIVARLINAGHLDEIAVPNAGRTWRLGEHVITRRNDRTLTTTGGDWVRNGDRWRIDVLHGPEGGLTLVSLDEPGRRLKVDADYIASNVERGYACTVHRAQGATVDRAQLYTTPNMPAAALYVGLTRGRHNNTAHTHTHHDSVNEHDAQADLDPTAVDPLDALRSTVARIDDNAAAIKVQRQHAHQARTQRPKSKPNTTPAAAAPSTRSHGRDHTPGPGRTTYER